MSFWSSQTIEAALPRLFPGGDRPIVDCNAITLTIAPEIYISPSWSDNRLMHKSLRRLGAGASFTIPPGQFGFLQTNEKVLMPKDAMGFISFKATFKMMGLVNVSGFHVDPGYHHSLTFAVFNAGPKPVHLKQGMELFLLWIASLDQPSDKFRTKAADPGDFTKMVNQVSGPVKSGYDALAKIEKVERRVLVLYTILMLLAGAVFEPAIKSTFFPDAERGKQAQNAQPSLPTVSSTASVTGTPPSATAPPQSEAPPPTAAKPPPAGNAGSTKSEK